jgi:hypothetical protein
MKTWKDFADHINKIRNKERTTEAKVDPDGRGVAWEVTPGQERPGTMTHDDEGGFLKGAVLFINREFVGPVNDKTRTPTFPGKTYHVNYREKA